MMSKYSKKSQDMVESAMHRMKEGSLKSSSGDKVKNPKQAIAIGLSEAREKGAKVPEKKSAAADKSKSSRTMKSSSRKSTAPAKKSSSKSK